MKKIIVPILAVAMIMLSACSNSDTTATATATATDSESSTIATDNDTSTFSYVTDTNSNTGYNISNSIMSPCNLVVADSSHIYYVKADSNGATHLYMSDKDGKNETLLIDNCGGNLNLINGNIVYSGQDLYDVYKYNIATKKTTRIFVGIYESIYVVDSTVYMTNTLGGIISCDMSGNNYQILAKTKSAITGYYNGYLYYSYYDSDTSTTTLYKTKVGENAGTTVSLDSSITPILVKDGYILCFTSDSTSSSYVFQLYSIDQNKIVNDSVLTFNPNVYGLNSIAMGTGSIYFSLSETVANTSSTASPEATSTATSTASSTTTVDNLYAFDISSQKTYNLGSTNSTLMLFAGGDLYSIAGNYNSLSIYSDITTLNKLNISGNAVTEQNIFQSTSTTTSSTD